MTRLEGILYSVAFTVLALVLAVMADSSISWVDWGVAVFMSVACLCYAVYYAIRVTDSTKRRR